MDLVIREARPDDLSQMVQLLEQLFAIEEDFNYEEWKQRHGLELLMKSEIAVILVAERRSRVVGMVTGQLVISTAEGGMSLLVEDMVVDVGWRGKGIGSELLANASDWGRKQGVRRCQLLADKNNWPAIEFYSCNGWKRTNLICLRERSMGERYERGSD